MLDDDFDDMADWLDGDNCARCRKHWEDCEC
jgi:hypothetical protein